MQIPLDNPVTPGDRADILDILRGIALLGICLANFAVLSLYVFLPPEQAAGLPYAGVDRVLQFAHYVFIDGKFYSLFSLLFGIGFSVIMMRLQRSKKNPNIVFYRRLFVLMLIGLFHALVLWEGDILVLYALLGMLLPLFRNSSDRTLLALWVILIFSPLLFDVLKVISGGQWDLSIPLRAMMISTGDEVGINNNNLGTWLLEHRSVGDLLDWNYSGFYARWDMLIGTNRLPKVMGMFLLGLYAGRKQLYERLEENRTLFKKVQVRSLFVGLPASVALAFFETDHHYLPDPWALADTLFYALSVVPMSLFYTTSIVLLFMRPAWKRGLRIFAPVGRMALTTYLMQSVAGIILFYGIGFGMGGSVGPSLFLPLAAGVYLLQVVFSHAWFTAFQYGPVEWIWRQLTYGRRLRIRKVNSYPAEARP